ncbi:MAG: malate dehydrogenase [Proteobacteria bacterium]|nr:MAG: malate dehydrogenase [Pseudomonadota bacterium]PIE17824.1 MAG: malate dehydrogenase [Pseudomonadota bacterium]
MGRKKIALIGGGQIGQILALLAAQREFGDVTIFDIPQFEGPVKGKALDLWEVSPVEGYDCNLQGTSDYKDIAGADVVIITAGLPRKPGMSRDDLLATNVKIISDVAKNVKEYAPDAFVIVVTNPLDAMVYTFHKVSGFPKERVCGMAGVLDTARWRAFIAMELNVSVEDVAGTVLGGHGPTMVPLPRLTTVGGVPLPELLDAETIERIAKRTREAGTEIVKLFGNGSAFFSPAGSAIQMAESYLLDKKRVLPCAALCEGEYGIDGLFIGVPCRIGAGGVEKIYEITLEDEERKLLEATVQAVKKTVGEVNV